MELKTKYQYTYFIYPYLIEKKDYANYLYSLLKNKKCKLKIFDRKKDIDIDSYFLPEIKNKLFWSLYLTQDGIKSYEEMDTKMKANILSGEYSAFFEYSLEQDVPAKIGEENGIFFDISKIEIICFATGICFLLIKTVLNSNNFSDVLNFNYKFRDINSKIGHKKEYDNIKIQTQKLNNMQNFEEFLKEISGQNLLNAPSNINEESNQKIKAYNLPGNYTNAKKSQETINCNLIDRKANTDTERLITYSYVCLEQDSWNENTDLITLEKEFEKYRKIFPASEHIDDVTANSKYEKELVYKEKYLYYGFSNNSNVLLTSASNIKNYTSLLFQYENEELYHFLYDLHQKIYLKKLNYEISKNEKNEKSYKEFLNFAQKDWSYEVTNDTKGIILEKYNKKAQSLEETYEKLKSKYELLYKEHEITKNKKQNIHFIIIIAILTIINILIGIIRK